MKFIIIQYYLWLKIGFLVAYFPSLVWVVSMVLYMDHPMIFDLRIGKHRWVGAGLAQFRLEKVCNGNIYELIFLRV